MASHPWYVDFRLNDGSIIEVHEGEAKNLASLGMGCKLEDWDGDKKAIQEPEGLAKKIENESKAIHNAPEDKSLPDKKKPEKILNKFVRKGEKILNK